MLIYLPLENGINLPVWGVVGIGIRLTSWLLRFLLRNMSRIFKTARYHTSLLLNNKMATVGTLALELGKWSNFSFFPIHDNHFRIGYCFAAERGTRDW